MHPWHGLCVVVEIRDTSCPAILDKQSTKTYESNVSIMYDHPVAAWLALGRGET